MKFETPDVMGWLRGLFGDVHIMGDLRKKRLLPVAAVLLAAIVAVPILVSKSAHGTPVAQAPNSTPPPVGAIPALSVQSTPPQSNLTGKARNPFQQQVIATATASKTTSTTISTSSSATSSTSSTGGASSGSSSSGSSSTGSSSSTGTSSTSTTPAATIPPGTGTPAPAGLTATQSYGVTLSITNPSGGVGTIDPLERLSVLPSDRQALLVELGVLQGGQRVLFAVPPGSVVTGPGRCIPGPIDCQILSLGQNQTEQLSSQLGTVVTRVALFAVTGIAAVDHSSVSAANTARRTESPAGRDVLSDSNVSALSLFRYDPTLGVVVDLRNLSVGG